jgi:protein ImuB
MSLQHDPLTPHARQAGQTRSKRARADPGAAPVRVACLLVPDMPLRAELRASPELRERPFVVATGPDARAEVLQVSPAARTLGVRPGGSVTHARAVSGDIAVRVASPALDRASRQALLDVALSFSPRALPAERSSWAFANEAAVFLDASGIAHLFDSERHFASAIGARAEALGLPAIVTIASSRSVAWIAARERARCWQAPEAEPGTESDSAEAGSALCVVPPGAESRFLGPLPIDLLDPDDALATQLTRFGIQTVKDLLGLPRRALAQRLGPSVLELVSLARGEEVDTPIPAPTDDRLEEAIDLDYPAERLEPLRFVLRGLLSRLMERLAVRHLACGPIDLHLTLASGGRDVRRIGVAAPTRDTRVLLRLVSLSLETRPPLAPIDTVSLSTRGQPARRDQLDLFRPNGPDPNELDRTLSELESLCGAGRVGAPEVADDHRPDAFAIKPFSPRPAAPGAGRRLNEPDAAAQAPGSLAVRALRPPVAAEVRVARGLPVSIRSGVANGQIVRSAGPWRTTGRWWSEKNRYALDHFDVQVSDGSVLRLCFDWLEKAWRVDGIYD